MKALSLIKENLLLFGIFLFALILRLWGINFGLPHAQAWPDELIIIGAALRVWQGSLNPHFFIYPHLLIYVLSLLYGVYFLALFVSGRVSSYDDFLAKTVADRTGVVLIDRALVALLGALTVVALYFLVDRMFKNRSLSVLSSALLAFVYLHVRDSHFGVTDVPMTFFIVVACYFIFLIYERGERIDHVLAGIFSGLAAGTKYNALLLAVSIFVSHLLRSKDPKSVLSKNMMSSIGFMLAAFFLTTPFLILDPSMAWFDFARHVFPRDVGMNMVFGPGWIHHVAFNLRYGLGLLFLLFGLFGLCLLFERKRNEAIILFSFPVLYYFAASWGHGYYVRYMVPVAPFLCVAAAEAIVRLSDLLSRFYKNKTVISVIFAIILLFPSLKNVYYFDNLLSKEDTRSIAYSWIAQNIRKGQTIGTWTSFWGMPTEIDSLPTLMMKRNVFGTDRAATATKLLNDMYIAARSFQKGFVGYNVMPAYWGVFDVIASPPDYFFVEVYPVMFQPEPSAPVINMLREKYTQVAWISSGMRQDPRLILDRADAFYLPFSGLEFVGRPGPDLIIFKRK